MTASISTDRWARISRWAAPAAAAMWLLAIAPGCSSNKGSDAPPGGDGNCHGIAPPAAAYDATPGPTTPAGAVSPTVGDPWPDWQLEDFQPQSCGFGAVYGGEVFRGQVTLVAFWSAW